MLWGLPDKIGSILIVLVIWIIGIAICFIAFTLIAIAIIALAFLGKKLVKAIKILCRIVRKVEGVG